MPEAADCERLLYTVAEVADRLATSSRTVYRLLGEGLPSVLLRGQRRVARNDLEAFVDELRERAS